MEKQAWKIAERTTFLDRLQATEGRRLLEVGAGTGQDSLFFQQHGLEVVATDLSAEMVARCRAKGLDARVMDFLHLDFPPGSFDAVHAMNCLLHVPNTDLLQVLEAIHRLLRPGGLLFVGTYRGEGAEGVHEADWHTPPRFFSFRTDEQLLGFAERHFDIVDFHVVDLPDYPFQSLTLRRPPDQV